MREEELFELFLGFLKRTKKRTSEVRERLVCNSFLYPLRCHPNCFPQGREIILAADKAVIYRIAVVVTSLTKTLISLFAKTIYRILTRVIRDIVAVKEVRSQVIENSNYWLMIDHSAVIGGTHKRVREASGYFPFIEEMEFEGLVEIKRIYHISEMKRFRLPTEQRVTSVLGIGDILVMMATEIKTAIQLVSIARKKEIVEVDRMGLYGAAIAQISFKTLEARMIAETVGRLLRVDRRLKGVITTFEGQTYERLVAIECAKEGLSHIAFQHSPFLETQYAVKETWGMTTPSRIFFSSKKAYMKIKKTGEGKTSKGPIMLVVGGSGNDIKSVKGGIKNEYFCPADMVGLPNGDDRELLLVLKEAEVLMQLGIMRRLILRFHPIARTQHYRIAKTFERRSSILADRVIMEGDERFDESLYDDCFYSLYVSSSASMKYLNLGIVPVVIGENNFHLSPQSSKVSVDDLISDFSQSAYMARLSSAKKDYAEIYSRSMSGRMVRKVAQLMTQDATMK